MYLKLVLQEQNNTNILIVGQSVATSWPFSSSDSKTLCMLTSGESICCSHV